MYSIVGNSELGTMIFANLIQTLTSKAGDSNQNYPGLGGGAPGGGRGVESPPLKRGVLGGQSPSYIKKFGIRPGPEYITKVKYKIDHN